MHTVGKTRTNLALAIVKMKEKKTFVNVPEYKKALANWGFKFEAIRKQFVISGAYLPKEYSGLAAEISLEGPLNSNISSLGSVTYYVRRGDGYEKTKSPDPDFKRYVEKILEDGAKQSMPKMIPT